MQRIFDIVFSGLAIIVLSPLLVPIMFTLRFTGEGEIFFRQQRVGRGGEKFGLLKFVTMLKDSPNMATGTVTVKNDPRILPIGRFLRKTKINELPQLFNILLGDMAVIGPRPQTQRCFDAFPARSQAEIIKIRPGLSGIGSVVFRDEEEMMDTAGDPDAMYDNLIMPYKGLLEEWYVQHRSLWVDTLLTFLTAWVVFTPQSLIVWRLFPNLPAPPEELRPYLNL
jgi:lipopolysaccharide/colanic/teichoic acid biosynthesis glycosyltransferase